MSAELSNAGERSPPDPTSKVEVFVPAKSDKTLKNNINGKDGSIRKRTSLVFVPEQNVSDAIDAMNNSAIDCENANEMDIVRESTTKNQDNDKNANDGVVESTQSCKTNVNDKGTASDRNSFVESVADSSDGRSTDDSSSSRCEDDEHEKVSTNSSSACTENSYPLRRFWHNAVGCKDDSNRSATSDVDEANILDDVRNLRDMSRPKCLSLSQCETLLSPHEVPMGRRYAEVSQFKGSASKRSSDPQSHSSHTTANASASQNPFKSSLSNGEASSATSIPANTDKNRNLPFSGPDSTKGNDKNAKTMDGFATGNGGGQTNLFFDLSDNAVSSAVCGGATAAGNMEAGSEQFRSLDASNESVVSCDAADGQFEDDMQALLPKCRSSQGQRPMYRDDLSQSRTSLVSSSDGGILAEGETSSENSRDSDDCPPCDLGLVERLLLTHPVWFLTSIQRSGAVHFLQGKEEGNFIVRGSSQPNTMAVSVRLPPDTGPYIEHYLIQSIEGILSLESSRFKFDSIPALIAHYAQCCDELPVQLVLPRALRETNNRQQLSSLALLGQEFWRYPMSCPKPSETAPTTTTVPELNHLNEAKSPNSLTETSGLGTMLFSNHSNSTAAQQPPHSRASSKFFSAGLFSQAASPSDTTSSLSSFTTSGGQHMQLMSPESVDSIILTMSPVDAGHQRNLPMGPSVLSSDISTAGGLTNSLSTFKSVGGQQQIGTVKPIVNNIDNGGSGDDVVVRSQRRQPPKTLNLDLRKPPAPPMRWAKPLSPNSPSLLTSTDHANFTITTTVTFSMDSNSNNSQFVEVTTPASVNPGASIQQNNATFQTFAKRLSPEGECKDTLSSQGSSSNGSHWQSQTSKDSNNSQRKILTPVTSGTPTTEFARSADKSRKSKARKESKHYQESDILESPQIYCQSALVDKISDYEDLWSNDPSDRTGLLSSFKPVDKRPDLLAETPSTNSLLTPIAKTPTIEATTRDFNCSADSQKLIQYSGDGQSRSPNVHQGLMSQSLSEDLLKVGQTNEGDTTPTPQSPGSRSKQGSPFYAEPADALQQATASIVRRSQRGPLLAANQRHSEPPKGGVPRTPMSPLLIPTEIEKIAGSLDELKKTQQHQPQQQHHSKRSRGRFEQWQLDSSWEFMGNNKEQEEYDEDVDSDSHHIVDDGLHSKQLDCVSQDKENMSVAVRAYNKSRPLTIHQIIAKRLPDLNLPELVRCSTPSQQKKLLDQLTSTSDMESNDQIKSADNHTSSRLSSYDNVERNLSYFFNGVDSAQSDDGTVFSEPWDSSQWDTLMPHDDTTVTNSDTIHLSKCRPAVSEDDTIIEELNTKDTNQDTLKAKKTNARLKVATILRSPSLRDREILCHPRNKINTNGSVGPGDSLRAYTMQLAQDQTSTFARNIENFISCTKESREAAPQVVMRNMRQFMNGMKNYLVKHGEGKFHQEVESARARLKSDEFLNLDAILERVMHQLVVLPLREHLYGMFVDYYTRSEDIQLLAQNVKYACGRNALDFGIRSAVTPPSNTSLMVISNLLLRLQEAEMPLDKLDLFLSVISTIFDATGCPRGQQLGADDFLPVLVYVVAKCGFVGAEIEAEFMWGLLQPTLLNGEPGYYLTALCSAVHVLKSFMASESENGTASLDWRSSSLPACSSVLRVIIPDECNGSLQTRTLPVRPNTTTREVCRIIAHKARITNPQDYALFKLVDGEETLLTDVECPQDIRLSTRGKHCMLAYKRIDAKIAWPTPQPQLHHKINQINGY